MAMEYGMEYEMEYGMGNHMECNVEQVSPNLLGYTPLKHTLGMHGCRDTSGKSPRPLAQPLHNK